MIAYPYYVCYLLLKIQEYLKKQNLSAPHESEKGVKNEKQHFSYPIYCLILLIKSYFLTLLFALLTTISNLLYLLPTLISSISSIFIFLTYLQLLFLCPAGNCPPLFYTCLSFSMCPSLVPPSEFHCLPPQLLAIDSSLSLLLHPSSMIARQSTNWKDILFGLAVYFQTYSSTTKEQNN